MKDSYQFQSDKTVLRYLIGDVRDKERMHRIMDGVDFIVHAAATKIVKIFNAENAFSKKFYESTNRLYKFSNSVINRKNLASPLSEFLGICSITFNQSSVCILSSLFFLS